VPTASAAGCLPVQGPVSRNPGPRAGLSWPHQQLDVEIEMPVILWLLGVPLVVIVLLMLFGVL